ncbi:MAG TPA: M15 family metallopeptidase [Anaeromyxobacteraceae bacterium]|nr:M15 family metallopeptidase [Anaeromyxobacteraceae bacterium]
MSVAGLAALLLLSGAPSLVDVRARIPDAVLDLRYATERNFLGRAVYPAGAPCLLQAPVADRLARAAARLRQENLRLVLWDCYRPLAVQREMWKVVPRPGYVADPAKGSNHNRGAAVDVAVAGPDGAPVPLPTEFDTFSPAAHAGAKDVPPPARKNRDRLRAAMEAEGFRVNRMEWWHFDAPEARGAPVLDVPLEPREAAR